MTANTPKDLEQLMDAAGNDTAIAHAAQDYRLLLDDIDSGGLFYRPDAKGAVSVRPPTVDLSTGPYNWVSKSLPVLHVPIGSIAWRDDAEKLPIVGILVAHEADLLLQVSLKALFSEHHRRPFCKFVFLCSRLDVLPFFRRYDFAVHHVPGGFTKPDFAEINMRYGVSQVREAGTGNVVWAASDHSKR